MNKKYKVLVAVALLTVAGTTWKYVTQPQCPTEATFSDDFNSFSIEFLAGHPEYGEKEQREGWDKHLEEMGCIEEQSIIDNAICADCEDNAL